MSCASIDDNEDKEIAIDSRQATCPSAPVKPGQQDAASAEAEAFFRGLLALPAVAVSRVDEKKGGAKPRRIWRHRRTSSLAAPPRCASPQVKTAHSETRAAAKELQEVLLLSAFGASAGGEKQRNSAVDDDGLGAELMRLRGSEDSLRRELEGLGLPESNASGPSSVNTYSDDRMPVNNSPHPCGEDLICVQPPELLSPSIEQVVHRTSGNVKMRIGRIQPPTSTGDLFNDSCDSLQSQLINNGPIDGLDFDLSFDKVIVFGNVGSDSFEENHPRQIKHVEVNDETLSTELSQIDHSPMSKSNSTYATHLLSEESCMVDDLASVGAPGEDQIIPGSFLDDLSEPALSLQVDARLPKIARKGHKTGIIQRRRPKAFFEVSVLDSQTPVSTGRLKEKWRTVYRSYPMHRTSIPSWSDLEVLSGSDLDHLLVPGLSNTLSQDSFHSGFFSVNDPAPLHEKREGTAQPLPIELLRFAFYDSNRRSGR
eukprot:CAMPEP_0113563632 /NCGR_PEP_ID=MMETSP0015_2-20120614/21175_1 /TAXON_ID=2838 /ORGANISM="Odontella" /LENGTH=482 /DNA_ID=CAMNT_0000465631 /DNA_START=344 /DNA_END=1789 /DNA_ORIENTATION=- /assembly_acc=CAM_ASM_000160